MAINRRLAAIVAADVVGYSRLMGVDEEGTLARLNTLRAQLIDPAIAKHGGRIFKTTGDGLLAEFSSVVEAVRCAIGVQQTMEARAETGIRFRIGIHVGDVIAEGDDLFGDGVNIAARLEALSEPGGICLSARSYEDVAGKTDADFEDWGEQRLKNIDRPVRVYCLRSKSNRSSGSEPSATEMPAPASRAAGAPVAASAPTLRQIGYLAMAQSSYFDEFRRALAACGHIDGQTIAIHTRWSGGVNTKLPELARELVDLGVDVIVTSASQPLMAARQATETIPIVMVEIGDPVGYGIVRSLMRPGGNVTGVSNAMHEFIPRGLRVFKEIVPDAVRVAVLAPQDNPNVSLGVKSVEEVANALDMTARTYNAGTADDIRTVLARLDQRNCDVLLVLPDQGLVLNRSAILGLAGMAKLPVISAAPDYARDGGLMSLGPSRSEGHRLAAYCVDTIFKGTPPSVLPIEEVAKSWLVLNLKTAGTLGIAIPAPILRRADEVIQ